MYNSIAHLALAALVLLSCKNDKDSARDNAGDVQLEVYKRGTEPTRAALSKAPPSWLGADTLPACPADALPKSFSEPNFNPEMCAGDRIDQCLEACKNSDATACYSAAILMQEVNDNGAPDISTPLYARSCQLGDASGCTNWAASMDQNLESNQDCLFRTFEATCLRGQDPWGCTMHAHRVSAQLPPNESLEKLRSLVATSCKWGESDPACQSLRTLIGRLESTKEPLRDAAAQ